MGLGGLIQHRTAQPTAPGQEGWVKALLSRRSLGKTACLCASVSPSGREGAGRLVCRKPASLHGSHGPDAKALRCSKVSRVFYKLQNIKVRKATSTASAFRLPTAGAHLGGRPVLAPREEGGAALPCPEKTCSALGRWAERKEPAAEAAAERPAGTQRPPEDRSPHSTAVHSSRSSDPRPCRHARAQAGCGLALGCLLGRTAVTGPPAQAWACWLARSSAGSFRVAMLPPRTARPDLCPGRCGEQTSGTVRRLHCGILAGHQTSVSSSFPQQNALRPPSPRKSTPNST